MLAENPQFIIKSGFNQEQFIMVRVLYIILISFNNSTALKLFDSFSRSNKHCDTFIPDWSVVIIKLKSGPTTKVDEKGDELLMKTTVKLEKGKSFISFS